MILAPLSLFPPTPFPIIRSPRHPHRWVSLALLSPTLPVEARAALRDVHLEVFASLRRGLRLLTPEEGQLWIHWLSWATAAGDK